MQQIIALWTLSSEPLGPTETSCAIEAISDAIAAHSLSQETCTHGLGALSTLASSRSLVYEADSLIDLVFSCMSIHSDCASVQQGALAALSKISVDHASNQVLLLAQNDLDVIVNAMRTHISAKDVQENAVILLRGFTYSSTNINMMVQHPFLVGLLKAAVSNFRGSLRVNVDDLLRVLPTDSQ